MPNSFTKAHADETRVPIVLGCVVTCAILCIAFVAMRFLSRQLSRGSMRLDLSDWLLVGALVRLPVAPLCRLHYL